MRFFDGFDKKDLIIGTSGFYVAALALIFLSMFLTDHMLLSKSDELYKRSNLTNDSYKTSTTANTLISYEIPLGFGSRVLLDNNITLSMVVDQVEAIMQSTEFASIFIVFSCSKIDCKVSFTATEDDKFHLTELANERFASKMSSQLMLVQPSAQKTK
ncbi:MAG: hypothetical protein ABJK37_00610 [Paraglaciecola sp.]|uniref:hypothetical protein n=1 Tax=Paraglaciecola sp. TaxID=1920173 RepID=UPI003296A0FA